MKSMKIKLKCYGVFFGVLILVSMIYILRVGVTRQNYCDNSLWSDASSEFEGFDNVTAVSIGKPIVPNYIHFLRHGWWMEEILLFDAVCILAAFKNHKPDKIFFHTDLENFTGKYWEKVLKTPGFLEVVQFTPIKVPNEIFKQKFTDEMNSNFHIRNYLRIQILMEHGGIYLDGDIYIVNNLDRYRYYEMSLGWNDGELLGTQILIAHKDARFLRLWLESYHNSYSDMLYFNVCEYPTRNILEYRPELVHRVKLLFGVQDLRGKMHRGIWQDWKKQFAVNVVTQHVDVISYYYENVECPEELTDEKLLKFSFTMRYLVDDIIPLQEGLNTSETH